MFFQDKMKQEYNKFQENFNLILSEKEQKAKEEQEKVLNEKEQQKLKIKNKCFPKTFNKKDFLTNEQLNIIFETFYQFMDKNSYQINFYEIYNFYKLYQFDIQNPIIFNIFQMIYDEIENGQFSPYMEFTFLIQVISEKLGNYKQPEKIFTIISQNQDLDLTKEDIQNILKEFDIQASSEQISLFLKKIERTKNTLTKEKFIELYKSYYNL